jgi:cytochrome P450
MLSISELNLPHLPLERTEFAADPLPYLARAKQQHPWLANSIHGYVVHEYQAIKDLLSMDDRLRVPLHSVVDILGARGTRWGRFMEEQMLNLSGETHRRLRGTVAPMFTPRQVNQNRALMRAKMSILLDEWAPKGSFDFEEFASFYPLSVLCALIGASSTVIPSIKSSLEALGLALAMDPSHLPALQAAMIHMERFAKELVMERLAHPKSGGERDLLDLLINCNKSGALTDTELTDMLINLFVAGYDTSKNIMTLTMSMLIERPEIYERCGRDLDYCQKVVEEALRFRSSTSVLRQVTEDIVYRHVLLPKGTLLWFTIPTAGRDPDAFENADTFDPDRTDENRHMAFGRGAHICLGQFIARAQIVEGMHLIAQRLKQPRLIGPVGYRPFTGAGGLKGLPIEFVYEPNPAL